MKTNATQNKQKCNYHFYLSVLVNILLI